MSTPNNRLAADRLVATLREQSELMRSRAAHLRAAGAEVRWHSSASTDFHDRLDRALHRFLQDATLLDEAADRIIALAAAS